MPSSSLFLRSSTTLVFALSLFSTASARGGPFSKYTLSKEYSGDSFYDGWDFFAEADPTHGFVTYLDESDAQTAGLLTRGNSGSNIIGVDSTNFYNPDVTYYGVNGVGRPSVRISTTETWTHGLFIADIANMPGGVCGIWPAFWTLGDGTWPYHGEIDILEGANDQTTDLSSLHTAGTCTIAGSGETGTLQANNCTYDVATGANSAGCGVSDVSTDSYGLDFNSNGGGVYAMEWTSEAIKIWFFPRASVPSDIALGSPNPSGWGTPDANFAGTCDIDSNFANHQIVIDATFCGDWAGAIWGDSCQASTGYATCQDFVANEPTAFTNMYWDINAIQVYQTGLPSTSTTTSTTSTTSSTSTTTSTSVTTTTRPYPIRTSTTTVSTTSHGPYHNLSSTSTTQSSSSSSTTSTSLSSVWPQGSHLGVPMGGGVGLTRSAPGHHFPGKTTGSPTGTHSPTGTSVVIGSSTAWYEWSDDDPSTTSFVAASSSSEAWPAWDPSATSSVAASSSSEAWPAWDPSTTSSAAASSSSEAWPAWDPSTTPSVVSSTSSSWPDWDPSTSGVSPASPSSAVSWDDWSASSTVTISASTVTVSPVAESSTWAFQTGASTGVSPVATATSAWNSDVAPAAYSASSTAWAATYTGAASSNAVVMYTIAVALGMLAMVL